MFVLCCTGTNMWVIFRLLHDLTEEQCCMRKLCVLEIQNIAAPQVSPQTNPSVYTATTPTLKVITGKNMFGEFCPAVKKRKQVPLE